MDQGERMGMNEGLREIEGHLHLGQVEGILDSRANQHGNGSGCAAELMNERSGNVGEARCPWFTFPLQEDFSHACLSAIILSSKWQ